MVKGTETTEVAVPTVGGVPTIGSELFNVGDQMEGVEAQLPQIKIIHQAQMFVFPGEEKVDSFKAVILDMNRTNAYWGESFDESGGGTPPTCSSLDGVSAEMNSEEIQSESGKCIDCPMNKFGSGKGGGKACKNMKRVHGLVDGSMMPMRLTVPPSNLKAVDLYVSLLTSHGVPYQLIETEFSLKAAQNKGGIEYSELVMKNVGPAPMIKTVEDAENLKAMIAQWRGIMRGEMVTGNEAEV